MLYELEKIKQMRQKLGLTQTQLAKLANVSQSLITKVERGTLEPSYAIAKRIFTTLENQLESKQKTILAKDICTKEIVTIKSDDKIKKAINLMEIFAISQLPVLKDNIIVGSVSEETFIQKYEKIRNSDLKVELIMDEPLPTLPEKTPIKVITEVLKEYSAVIVTKNGKPTGIVTKADLMKNL